jgi:transposase-like protein
MIVDHLLAMGGYPFKANKGCLTQLMERSEEEVLAYLAFAEEHWRQVWSNHP